MPSEEIPQCLSDLNKALNVLVQDVKVCVEKGINTHKPAESDEFIFNEYVTAPVAEEKVYNKEIRSKCHCTCSSCSNTSKKQKSATPSTEDRLKNDSSETTTREPKTHDSGAAATTSSPLPKVLSNLNNEKKGSTVRTIPLLSPDGSRFKYDEISTVMGDFWRTVKDESHFKLPQEMRSRMYVEACTGSTCRACCGLKNQKSPTPSAGGKSKPASLPTIKEPEKNDYAEATARTNLPLRKALSNLKNAASFEKDIEARVSDLLLTQQSLTQQVQYLEEKEKKEVEQLRKADSMWSSMEEQYKKQLDDKKETYKILLNEKKELDTNIHTWRKTQKDLEFKIKNLDNNSQEITVKKIKKGNDIKVLQMEIESYKKRIATNAKDLEGARNSYDSKKKASEARLQKMAGEMQKIQEKVTNECQCKEDKEQEGTAYLKEARDDLQKICRCLLQKKLENEDLRAEKEALIQEIDLLKATADTCSERCARREKNIAEETKKINKEISDYQVKCIQCHKFTDSVDLTGYCIDCPRCVIKRECMIKGNECFTDHTKDCVCTRVKEKFLDNVFENMYSVLEKQAKTCPGKEVADCIFTCLERSRNGKLDENTRSILQEFILSTVKKNLNLTIIGGAVKTRCEMDPEMYRQLMLCLKDVNVPKPPRADKAIAPRKPPCSRWNETTECNCPRGPKNCPCTKKAPKPPTEPGSCGQPYGDEIEGSLTTIPTAPDVWTRQPCTEESCTTGIYGTNMRAAQCVLGPDALSKVRTHSKRPTLPTVPSATCTNNTVHVDDHPCEMCAARGNYSRCDCPRFPNQNKIKI